MFRKSYWKKRFAPVLAGALVISSLLVPPGHAFAADPVTSEEQTVSPETPEVKDVTDSTDAATTDANLTTPDSVSDSVSDSVAGTSATDASSAKEAAKQDVKETKEAKLTMQLPIRFRTRLLTSYTVTRVWLTKMLSSC